MSSIGGLRKVVEILEENQELDFLTALLAADNRKKYFSRFKSSDYRRMNNRVGVRAAGTTGVILS
jgi:methylglyoxal synthase